MPPIIQPRRLPTVRLVHRKDPKNVRVVDQRIYAIAPERWRDFKIETFLNQQADPDVVETAVREWEINEKRLAERDAKKDWEFTSKQTDHNVVTEPVATIETSFIPVEVPDAPPTEGLTTAYLTGNVTTDATINVRPGKSRDMTPKRRGRPPKVKG